MYLFNIFMATFVFQLINLKILIAHLKTFRKKFSLQINILTIFKLTTLNNVLRREAHLPTCRAFIKRNF